MSKNAFGRKLEERGFVRDRSAKVRGFRGITVRPIEPMSPGEMKNAAFIGPAPMTTESPEQIDDSIDGEGPLAH